MKKSTAILSLFAALAFGCGENKTATQEGEIPAVASAETLTDGSSGTSHFKKENSPLATFPWDNIGKIEASHIDGQMFLSHDIQDIVFLEEEELDAEEHGVYRNYLKNPTHGLFGFGMPMEFGYFVVPEGKLPFGLWYKSDGNSDYNGKDGIEQIELVIPYYGKQLYLFRINMVESPNNILFENKEGYLGRSVFSAKWREDDHYLLLTAK